MSMTGRAVQQRIIAAAGVLALLLPLAAGAQRVAAADPPAPADTIAAKLLARPVTIHLRRVPRLVNELVEVSRDGSGPLVLHREDTDLGALVQDVVDELRPDFAAAGCTLELDRDGTISFLILRLVARVCHPGYNGDGDGRQSKKSSHVMSPMLCQRRAAVEETV